MSQWCIASWSVLKLNGGASTQLCSFLSLALKTQQERLPTEGISKEHNCCWQKLLQQQQKWKER